MPWWVAILKPGNKSPYLEECRDEDDADGKVEKAEGEGLSGKKYHTGSDDIYEAKQVLRSKVAEDFGYEVGTSNFRR